MRFLRLPGTFAADLNLVVQIAMGTALLMGWRLARARRFDAHKRCQTTVVLLNLVAIGTVMAPAFGTQVLPNLRHAASDRYAAWALAHASLGTFTELLALYVVLVARGVRVVPLSMRFRNYRAWMRMTLILWWAVIGLGVATFAVWYGGSSGGHPAAADVRVTSAAAMSVTLQNFEFSPMSLTVPVGTTVIWTDAGGRHSIEAADGSFKSDTLVAGQSFSHRFDRPGTFEYQCGFHGMAGMTGRIVVTAR